MCNWKRLPNQMKVEWKHRNLMVKSAKYTIAIIDVCICFLKCEKQIYTLNAGWQMYSLLRIRMR